MSELTYNKERDDLLHKNIFDSLARIETQTVKHNGRMTKMESWRWLLTGAISILAFFLPFFMYYFSGTLYDIQSKIDAIQKNVDTNTTIIANISKYAKD